MSEDRLLQSFCALLGAIVLVASVHIFLLATSAPRLEAEPEVRTSLLPEAEPVARAAMPVAPEIVTAREAAETAAAPVTASADAETVSPQSEAGLVATDAGAELATAAQPADAPAIESPETPPAVAEAETSTLQDGAQDLASIAEPAPTEAEIEAASVLEAAATDHAFVSEPSDQDYVAAAPAAEPVQAETPVAEAVPVEEAPSSYATASSSLEELIAETIGASEEAPLALAVAANLDEAVSPTPPAVRSYEADPSTTGAVDNLPEITVPLRKPQPPAAQPEPVKSVEKPEPEKSREQPERHKVAAARAHADNETNAKKPLWKPMTLGFAKDRKREVEQQPKPARETKAAEPAPAKAKPASSGAYRAQVWAKLARHRPRLGKPGSTTVVFTVGPSGALRSARVGRSSGNTALDQRALAAVRAAAPFPAPPGGLSASALTFSIQIYFR